MMVVTQMCFTMYQHAVAQGWMTHQQISDPEPAYDKEYEETKGFPSDKMINHLARDVLKKKMNEMNDQPTTLLPPPTFCRINITRGARILQ
jgi:hypothetical protein